MTTSPLFVGVDVAKERLDVAVRPSGESWSVATDEAGVAALVARLRPLAPTRIVCEATGGVERAAIVALAAAGLPVVVANPRQVRDFARATGQLAKTDQLAAILALFAERVRPTPRPLPDAAAQLLDAVLTRRRQLLEMLRAEKNRLGFTPKPLHRGQPPVGGAPPAALRGRPARVPHVPQRHADHRLRHAAVGDRPDPDAPPRPPQKRPWFMLDNKSCQ
jgi:transposase